MITKWKNILVISKILSNVSFAILRAAFILTPITFGHKLEPTFLIIAAMKTMNYRMFSVNVDRMCSATYIFT